MLDSFKKGGNPAANDLQALIASSREERAALSTMLTQIQLQSSKLAAAGKALQNVEELVGRANERLERVTERLDAADAKAHVLEDIDRRIAALLDGLARAEQQAAQLTGPGGELENHRRAVDGLAARAAEAFASLDALRQEHGAIEQVRADIRAAVRAAAEVAERTGVLQSDLTQLQSASAGMSGELAHIQKLSRETAGHATATVQTVKDVERRLESLATLQQTSAQAEERLASLQKLAADVEARIRALDGQKATVERAVAESNRLNELIRNMEVQITALRDAGQHAAAAQALIDRVDQLSRDVTSRLEAGLRARDEFVAELRQLDDARASVAEILRLQADRVAAGGRELDAMDERVKSLTSVTADLERRASTLAAARALIEQQMRTAEEQVQRLQEAARAAEDKRRQLSSADERLGVFQGRLAELQSLTSEVERRIEQVAKREASVNAVRDQIQTVQQLGAQSRADVEFIQSHGEGIAVIRQQVDRLLAAIGQAEPKVTAIEDGARAVQDVDAQTRSLMSLLEDVKAQINGLDAGRLAELVREAQAAVAALQGERELAERLQRGMRQARSKNADPADRKKPA